MNPSAFVPATPVAQSLAKFPFVGHPPQCQRPLVHSANSNVGRRALTPTMITTTIAAEALAATTVLGGAFFFFLRSKNKKEPEPAKPEAASPKVADGISTAPVVPWQREVIRNAVTSSNANGSAVISVNQDGSAVFTSAASFSPGRWTSADRSTSNSSPVNELPVTMKPVPQAWENTSVGVFADSNPVYRSASVFTPEVEEETDDDNTLSLAEEFNWAVSQVESLDGCDGVLLIDTREERILAQTGSLVPEGLTDTYGSLRLPRADNLTCTEVSDQNRMVSELFANPNVNSFAKARIGETVQMVVLSPVLDFLGPKEQLMVTSVCEKLGQILQHGAAI